MSLQHHLAALVFCAVFSVLVVTTRWCHYTCLIGIFSMVYYNPHITRQYNPLYTLNNQVIPWMAWKSKLLNWPKSKPMRNMPAKPRNGTSQFRGEGVLLEWWEGFINKKAWQTTETRKEHMVKQSFKHTGNTHIFLCVHKKTHKGDSTYVSVYIYCIYSICVSTWKSYIL